MNERFLNFISNTYKNSAIFLKLIRKNFKTKFSLND